MNNIVIRAENVGKSYVIGHNTATKQDYSSLRDTLANGARELVQKTRAMFTGRSIVPGTEIEEFWALKDINFEIRQGERVGIIGRNGAGKSTLLKILSRIVEPTTGQIQIRGRVSSLLEVGTGFHPELTGRENIYLNGAILGMTKREITRKFDEIVDFAEVEKFLDTPVKHYSSGMYVRLAFAVAAHLEPEILIIDEVLAVGDAQFQQKCLGKMESVGREGRTVLFVSHSMPAVTSLCDRTLLLEHGMIIQDGSPSETILNYYNRGQSIPFAASFTQRHVGDNYVQLLSADVSNYLGQPAVEIPLPERLTISMDFKVLEPLPYPFVPNFHFMTAAGVCAFVTVAEPTHTLPCGTYKATCEVPSHLLNEGAYFVGLAISSFGSGVKVHFFESNALSFNVADNLAADATRGGWTGAMPGAVRPKLKWSITSFSI